MVIKIPKKVEVVVRFFVQYVDRFVYPPEPLEIPSEELYDFIMGDSKLLSELENTDTSIGYWPLEVALVVRQYLIENQEAIEDYFQNGGEKRRKIALKIRRRSLFIFKNI